MLEKHLSQNLSGLRNRATRITVNNLISNLAQVQTMTSVSSFHVRHDLLPSHTHEVITLLRAINGTGTLDEIQQSAERHGDTIRNRKDWSKPLKSLPNPAIPDQINKHLHFTDFEI